MSGNPEFVVYVHFLTCICVIFSGLSGNRFYSGHICLMGNLQMVVLLRSGFGFEA